MPGPMVEPIARAPDGAPLAYAGLGFAFHLAPLEPADVAGLAAACERVNMAHAGALRWAYSSVHGAVEPFSVEVLDLVSTFPTLLANPAPTGDARADRGTSAMAAAHLDRFGVACHGGPAPQRTSPASLRFFVRVRPAEGERLRADAMLAASFPPSMPAAELEALAVAVAGDLRVRWGAAGHVYSAWELDRYGAVREALFAHARRHPGFDLGQHATWMPALSERLRTVSWLTVVGPELVAKLPPSALATGPTMDDEVSVTPCGEGFVLRAGNAPAAGDVNRDDFPRAYVAADRRLRAVRAAEGLHFYAPWSSRTTEAWLRRFER